MIPIRENQVDKDTGNYVETGVIKGSLAFQVYKKCLHWDLYSVLITYIGLFGSFALLL